MPKSDKICDEFIETYGIRDTTVPMDSVCCWHNLDLTGKTGKFDGKKMWKYELCQQLTQEVLDNWRPK